MSAVAADERHAEPGGVYTTTAKVLDVTPIIRRERVSEPTESCRIVRTGASHRPRRHRIEPPHRVLRSVVGSLIGGAIGNQIGGGNGRKVATVAGALAGAQIANRGSRERYYEGERGYRSYEGETVEQCTQTERVRHVDHVSGYRVRYRYQGKTYTKITDQDPGTEIALTARVRPVVSRHR